MNTKNIIKLFFAVVLTLTIAIGSEIVANQIGMSITPPVYACGGTGGSGGGC